MKPLVRHTYYYSKPWLPLPFRMALRRWLARRILARCGQVWPIKPGTERPPPGWKGWPEGKQFALVLTHDVEGSAGLERCQALANLESRLGFISSFNFVPEGPYRPSLELRQSLTARGFEVGIHDLKHDGKLFLSRRTFGANARRINDYLRQWQADGFRAGFMLHNLDWFRDLEIKYDASTFDTDPFEPQPDGVDTIFPFQVPGAGGQGYVELPYTLPQDSTLFLLLGHTDISVWKRKLDWIAEQGGMALLITHPDYMAFPGATRGRWQFPAELYQEFLEYARTRYAGRYWNAVPREVAKLVAGAAPAPAAPKPAPGTPAAAAANGARIWIDLDNTPHVPFFEPIIAELRRRGHEVVVTARDAFQVCELARKKNLGFIRVGRHHGRNPALKLTGLFVRALQLAPVILREKPALAVSHGSRSQFLLCNLIGLPSVLLADYEYARHLPLMHPDWEMVPEVIPSEGLYCPPERIRKYPGIKEDVYVSQFHPDSSIRQELGLSASEIVVTARPPATEAHYHNPESEALFQRFMDRACRAENVRVVLLPRNRKQGEWLRATCPYWFRENRVVIPAKALDGLNLLWHSDLVVSGGGTMNREAATLGVPVYSIFRGPIGAVDRFLRDQGRLVLIQSLEEVDRDIPLRHRRGAGQELRPSSPALLRIVDQIEDILRSRHGGARD